MVEPGNPIDRLRAELPAAPDAAALIDAWLRYLVSEKQLAEKTILSYLRDLRDFLLFMQDHEGRQPDREQCRRPATAGRW